MTLLTILAIIVLLAWANIATVRRFRSGNAAWGWWATVLMLWAVGTAVGVWGGFFFEYQPSSKLRILGAPVPVVAFQLEGTPDDQHWVDFVTPAPLLFAVANVVLVPLLLGCPVGLVFSLRDRRKQDTIAS
jgi:hypothetical protein